MEPFTYGSAVVGFIAGVLQIAETVVEYTQYSRRKRRETNPALGNRRYQQPPQGVGKKSESTAMEEYVRFNGELEWTLAALSIRIGNGSRQVATCQNFGG